MLVDCAPSVGRRGQLIDYVLVVSCVHAVDGLTDQAQRRGWTHTDSLLALGETWPG